MKEVDEYLPPELLQAEKVYVNTYIIVATT